MGVVAAAAAAAGGSRCRRRRSCNVLHLGLYSSAFCWPAGRAEAPAGLAVLGMSAAIALDPLKPRSSCQMCCFDSLRQPISAIIVAIPHAGRFQGTLSLAHGFISNQQASQMCLESMQALTRAPGKSRFAMSSFQAAEAPGRQLRHLSPRCSVAARHRHHPSLPPPPPRQRPAARHHARLTTSTRAAAAAADAGDAAHLPSIHHSVPAAVPTPAAAQVGHHAWRWQRMFSRGACRPCAQNCTACSLQPPHHHLLPYNTLHHPPACRLHVL